MPSNKKGKIESNAVSAYLFVDKELVLNPDIMFSDRIKSLERDYVKNSERYKCLEQQRNLEQLKKLASFRSQKNVGVADNGESSNDVIISDENGSNPRRINEFVVTFNRKPSLDMVEFGRQLQLQQDGLNKLTVAEFIRNRDEYLTRKANDTNDEVGAKAQQAARQEAFADKVMELRRDGFSEEEAEKEAAKWLDGQNALHSPDRVAGGDSDGITGVGDKRVNFSLGGQWKAKDRISALDSYIREIAKELSDDEKNNTYLDVKLIFINLD